ncbi:MAG: tRNA (adenosine(37)-N6)-threonylcarbamoyltransferase complex dimerization subunit type 1 TsaB [Candidatus Eisenbacteria bacterium]|uniref:tRNA (Adenosine(37)-N6)-threonylcarbamoyltransferase complex dimerization subunit type 1 TsaB n=1 Tax=Eiseniibacteriota bacterium TaxID=2212470 RepID=A0A933W0T6_UNCEI|nr:tRNA (adenosine(37)-N6)-threonylcarbamoyltransferase complex dimerization subunit type 1 TsaB [Candidatus Eisenbacteria bacterium]
MTGLSIEAATDHVEVAVLEDGAVRAHVVEDVGHGHTRRLTALVQEALRISDVTPSGLAWVAAGLGPGSFTGVRVGLATARGFAFAGGARLVGASSLASLAHATPARRSLVVPLVGAGRRDVYAGFFRADTRGQIRLVAAPRVVAADALLAVVAEVHALLPGWAIRFVGPGAARERERLEAAYPTSTALEFRHGGLSALDLAAAALKGAGPGGGPGAGLPAEGREADPVYVRSAQAEERVRRAALGATPTVIRHMTLEDVPAVAETEARTFSDAWSESYFRSLIGYPGGWIRVAERGGQLAGYLVSGIQPGTCDLENICVLPAHRRCGVAQALMADLFEACRAQGAHEVLLEVRVSNDAAQALYCGLGFRLAGVRRGYYRAPDEDALLMACRVPAAPAPAASAS